MKVTFLSFLYDYDKQREIMFSASLSHAQLYCPYHLLSCESDYKVNVFDEWPSCY